jgi:hypothetical protein
MLANSGEVVDGRIRDRDLLRRRAAERGGELMGERARHRARQHAAKTTVEGHPGLQQMAIGRRQIVWHRIDHREEAFFGDDRQRPIERGPISLQVRWQVR